MRAKNTISIRQNSRRFIKCFRLSGNDTHDRKRDRERERRRKKKKERSKDYSTPFLQPLNDAKKDRTGFLRRPEARPYWPVSIEIRTCASRPRRRLWPLDTGGPVVEIERGKKRGREGGLGARIFVHRHPLCNKCLGPGRRCCLFASTNFLRELYGENLWHRFLVTDERVVSVYEREKRMLNVYAQVVPFSRGPKLRLYMNFRQFLFFLFSSVREIVSILRDK